MTDAKYQETQQIDAEVQEPQQRAFKVGKKIVSVDEDKLPHLGVIAASIILIVAVTNGEEITNVMRNYGIALASIAMIISFLSVVPQTAAMLEKFSVYINYFLFVWCFIGACVLTFGDGPFDMTGNGYFASWALATFSSLAMGINSLSGDIKEATAGMTSMLGMGACSIVVLIALISDFKNYEFIVKGEMIFGLITCITTILVVASFTYFRTMGNATLKKMEFPTLAVFALMWILSACFNTFRGPFEETSNGYFASWGGAILAVKAAQTSRKESTEQSEQVIEQI